MKKNPQDGAKKSDRGMTVVLALAVVAAVGIGLATRASHGAGARAEEPLAAVAMAADSAQAPAADDAGLSGEVLETVPVSKYTYLRLRTTDGETWAAVPSASVAVGAHVTIANSTRMDDFKSATLGKSFKVIYFGTLGEAAGTSAAAQAPGLKYPVGEDPDVDPAQALPPGHPAIGANAAPAPLADDAMALPPGHPALGNDTAVGASPHSAASAGPSLEPPLPMPKISAATGGNGRVIAALMAERQKLAGQRVRVRGQVTKVTPDVQGHAFFHLRDGSVSGTGPGSDIVLTALIAPERGQVATFEGILRADHDIGIGYKYPVLLEDATVVGEGK